MRKIKIVLCLLCSTLFFGCEKKCDELNDIESHIPILKKESQLKSETEKEIGAHLSALAQKNSCKEKDFSKFINDFVPLYAKVSSDFSSLMKIRKILYKNFDSESLIKNSKIKDSFKKINFIAQYSNFYTEGNLAYADVTTSLNLRDKNKGMKVMTSLKPYEAVSISKTECPNFKDNDMLNVYTHSSSNGCAAKEYLKKFELNKIPQEITFPYFEPELKSSLKKAFPDSLVLKYEGCLVGAGSKLTYGMILQNYKTDEINAVAAIKQEAGGYKIQKLNTKVETDRVSESDFLSVFRGLNDGVFYQYYGIACANPSIDQNLNPQGAGVFIKPFSVQNNSNENHLCFQADNVYNSWVCFNLKGNEMASSYAEYHAD